MKHLTLFAVMLFFAASLAQAQKQYDELEYPELNKFNEPEVETFTTDNGIQFFLLEDRELPLIDVNVDVRTGGVMVPNDQAGLASLTGSVMRSGGTASYPADSLNKLLENNAANMSSYVTFTRGGAGINVLKEDFDEILPIFIDMLTHPAFPEEKIELAKTQAKTAISRRNDSPGQIAAREFDQLIYGEDSKYGRTTEYATINNITREDMVAFHNKYYTGKNMQVGVVGDFDAEVMKEKLTKAFAAVPAGQATNLEFPEVNYNYVSTINLANKPDVNQSTVLLGHIGGMRDNPDYAEVQVMNNVLSGGFSGRLFQKIRTDLGLAYSVGGQYGMGNPFYPGQFFVQVQTKTSTTAEAINAIVKEIKRLQNEPISQEELENTKDQFLNSLVFRNTSYEQILNRRMNNEYGGLPEDSFEEFVKGVKNTTVEDVQNMAQKYLHPEKLQILVVGNKEELGDQLQQFGNVNELDISIPQPGQGKEKQAVEGDAQKGKVLLQAMADAIIEPNQDVNTLSLSGEVEISQMGQSQTLPVTIFMDYPDAIKQSITTGAGKMELSYKDGKGTMKIGGQERPMPPQMVANLKETLNRSVVAIAMKAENVSPQFLGTEKMDGKAYNKVNVTVDGKNVVLLLSKETNLPAVMRYQQFSPQQGAQVTVEDRYSNWNSADGVTLPYTQATYVDGNKTAEAIYKEHQVNSKE